MKTLEDAWKWYVTTKTQLQLLGRLGQKYWDDLPWEGRLARDDRFKMLDPQVVEAGSVFCLEHLDDFAILVLFSVFESIVRDKVISDIQNERGRLSGALVTRIVDDAVQKIEEGSFFRVLELFKNQDANLVEEVNQVRNYRNWVAHGRRNTRPDNVEPRTAFDRLKRFLDTLT
jgi:hypothetical protein